MYFLRIVFQVQSTLESLNIPKLFVRQKKKKNVSFPETLPTLLFWGLL